MLAIGAVVCVQSVDGGGIGTVVGVHTPVFCHVSTVDGGVVQCGGTCDRAAVDAVVTVVARV